MPSTFSDDVNVQGTLTANRFRPPASSITDTAITSAADIDDGKMRHRYVLPYAQAPGSNIAAATQDIHIVRSANGGNVLAVEAAITGVAAGGDRTASVDLQKSTGGGAFATVLSATIDFDSGDSLRSVLAGTIPSPALVDGDILRVVITVGGTTGTQPQGLVVSVAVMEKA